MSRAAWASPVLRRSRRSRWSELLGARGSAVRLRRSQRCRQDDDDANHLRPAGAGPRQRVVARRSDRRAVRERIGYMPEERGLVSEDAARAISSSISRFCTARPTGAGGRPRSRGWSGLGWAIASKRRVEALSHGNQQRVQLAAALVHQPDVLILDEPFAGLDPIATDVMADVLRAEAARGVPVLFSSHQLELVEQLCEAVAIIDHGRLIACGEVERASLPRPPIDPRRRPRCRPGLDRRAHGCRARGAHRLANGVEAWFIGRSSAHPRYGAQVRVGDAFRGAPADARGVVPRGGVRDERTTRRVGGRSA